MRRFVSVCVCLLLASWASTSAEESQFRVVLLGTGGPVPMMSRFGPSTLVTAGSECLLFDAGRGAMQRLNEVDSSLDCRNLFVTHLHSDHVVGIPDVYLTGWLMRRRTEPFHVWGPRGTTAMMNHLREAFSYDIRIRVADDGLSPVGATLDVHDIEQGVVFEHNGVRVSAITVDHRPIEPAFGYRIDYNGHSVVLSGDTRFSENLIAHATGVDLLVHEVAASADPAVTQATNRILAHHTMPDQAGLVFTRVHPKLAAYSHVGLGGLTEEQLIAQTRKTYAGPLIVGADLMTLTIGDTVQVGRVSTH